jgi:hypothetical protein
VADRDEPRPVELPADHVEGGRGPEHAERAGVAGGTLYRHFPIKTALVAAVVADSVEAIAAMADAALDRVRAGAAPAAELEAGSAPT